MVLQCRNFKMAKWIWPIQSKWWNMQSKLKNHSFKFYHFRSMTEFWLIIIRQNLSRPFAMIPSTLCSNFVPKSISTPKGVKSQRTNIQALFHSKSMSFSCFQMPSFSSSMDAFNALWAMPKPLFVFWTAFRDQFSVHAERKKLSSGVSICPFSTNFPFYSSVNVHLTSSGRKYSETDGTFGIGAILDGRDCGIFTTEKEMEFNEIVLEVEHK